MGRVVASANLEVASTLSSWIYDSVQRMCASFRELLVSPLSLIGHYQGEDPVSSSQMLSFLSPSPWQH